MKKPKETIEEYDKRVWTNFKFIVGIVAFLAFQMWLVDLLGIAV